MPLLMEDQSTFYVIVHTVYIVYAFFSFSFNLFLSFPFSYAHDLVPVCHRFCGCIFVNGEIGYMHVHMYERGILGGGKLGKDPIFR